MSTEVKLPELGDGIDSGDVLDILVSEGERIEKGQGIIELETDKATVEVPSSHAGTVSTIHVSTGQSVPVGAALITVEAESAAPAPPAAAAEQPTAAETPVESGPAEPSQPPRSAGPEPRDHQPSPASGDARPAPEDEEQTRTAHVPSLRAVAGGPETPAGQGVIPAGPAVRRFAREVGVNLSQLTGSGSGGRITREDVLEAVRQSSRAVGDAPSESEADRQTEASLQTDQWGPVRLERMTRIRRTIAAKMSDSWSTVPRVTNFDDADVTELEGIRRSNKADYAAKGIKLTSLPFVVKSVAMALKSHGVLNASLDLENQQIIYKDYVNIGVAVDTERGLIVPVIRGADKMSIPDIARRLARLAEDARTNNFTLEDLRGATFSISNLGAVGGTYSTPIVNTPEVAILLVGRTRKMPVVRDDQIAARLMMPLSLSYDHRMVDGAAAARFLNEMIGYLEAPGRLLLAP